MKRLGSKENLVAILNMTEDERLTLYGETVNPETYKWVFGDGPDIPVDIIRALDPYYLSSFTMKDAEKIALAFNAYLDKVIAAVETETSLILSDFRKMFALTDVTAYGYTGCDFMNRAMMVDYFAAKILGGWMPNSYPKNNEDDKLQYTE